MMDNTTTKTQAQESAVDCSALFAVGDRVTLIASQSLPDSLVGKRCIIVNMEGDPDYMGIEVVYRMDGGVPIRMGEDIIANEHLERINMRHGWQANADVSRRAENTNETE